MHPVSSGNEFVLRPTSSVYDIAIMAGSYRTVLRAFLLLGGLAYVLFGTLAGTTLDIGIGLLAAIVGGIGLWWERSAGSREPAQEE